MNHALYNKLAAERASVWQRMAFDFDLLLGREDIPADVQKQVRAYRDQLNTLQTRILDACREEA